MALEVEVHQPLVVMAAARPVLAAMEQHPQYQVHLSLMLEAAAVVHILGQAEPEGLAVVALEAIQMAMA
jgi:hypothetical protein